MTKIIKFLLVSLLILYIGKGTSVEAQNELLDLISDANCVSYCWLGIQPGITTSTQLESILSSNAISFEKNILGRSGDFHLYNVLSGYSHPLVKENAIVIYTDQGLVTSIDILLLNVQINDVVNDFGNPSEILNDNVSDILLYKVDNISFNVISSNQDHVFNIEIMSTLVTESTYENYLYNTTYTCMGSNQLCALVNNITCNSVVNLSDSSALTSAIVTANGAGEAYTICLENS